MKIYKCKIINSFVVSAIIVVIFIAGITIVTELFSNVKSLLADTFVHHWIGKGVLAILLFLALAFLYNLFHCEHEREKTPMLIAILAIVTILSFFVILGFYVYEVFLSAH